VKYNHGSVADFLQTCQKTLNTVFSFWNN